MAPPRSRATPPHLHAPHAPPPPRRARQTGRHAHAHAPENRHGCALRLECPTDRPRNHRSTGRLLASSLCGSVSPGL
eukprot:4547251-Prymnesium_polylepis.2